MNAAEVYIEQALLQRMEAGNYRLLKSDSNIADFCSNDYLGFARSPVLGMYIDEEMKRCQPVRNGSGGSRLLAGNTAYAETLEQFIAVYHGLPSATLYNSGYDANVGLFSSLPQRGDTVIIDELAHASIIDGIRLSHANRFSFRHNDMGSLDGKLKKANGRVYIAVESIYSMDGDAAPLAHIAGLAKKYGAMLIVDEAHATGVFGKGMVEQLGLESAVFAKLVTYGKAMGCHGAAVLGSTQLRNYLINFSRSFIYTTAAPLHQLVAIRMAYRLLDEAVSANETLQQRIRLFKASIDSRLPLIPASGPIQCLLMHSNANAQKLAQHLQNNGLDVRAVKSPTVPVGTERLRICLHAYNTDDEVTRLANVINQFKV